MIIDLIFGLVIIVIFILVVELWFKYSEIRLKPKIFDKLPDETKKALPQITNIQIQDTQDISDQAPKQYITAQIQTSDGNITQFRADICPNKSCIWL